MPPLKPNHISPTPEEDAAIRAAIASDPDTKDLTDADWAQRRPTFEVAPHVEEFLRKERAARKACPKTRVTIRLDDDLLARLREGGPGWRTRANDALRRAVLGA